MVRDHRYEHTKNKRDAIVLTPCGFTSHRVQAIWGSNNDTREKQPTSVLIKWNGWITFMESWITCCFTSRGVDERQPVTWHHRSRSLSRNRHHRNTSYTLQRKHAFISSESVSMPLMPVNTIQLSFRTSPNFTGNNQIGFLFLMPKNTSSLGKSHPTFKAFRYICL